MMTSLAAMRWGAPAAVLVAGCLSSPPGSIAADAARVEDQVDAVPPPGLDAYACADLPPLAPFADDFSNDALSWAVPPLPGRSGAGAISMEVVGGQLVFKPSSAGGDYAWLQTEPFDFTRGRIALRVPAVTTDSSSQPYIGMIGPGAEEMLLRFDGTKLITPRGTWVLYAPEVHVWWQLSSEDGIVHYQTSPDGVSWSDIDAGPPDYPFDDVRFEVGINVDSAGDPERGLFAIDDLDLPPCGG